MNSEAIMSVVESLRKQYGETVGADVFEAMEKIMVLSYQLGLIDGRMEIVSDIMEHGN